MDFANNLKEARLSAGLTQRQVAELLGITSSTYCGYEIGKRQPDVAKIKALSAVLHTTADALLGTGYSLETALHGGECEDIPKVLVDTYRRLSGKGREMLLNYGAFLISSEQDTGS